MASLVSQAPSIVTGTSAGSLGNLPPRDPAAWTLDDARKAVSASYPTPYDAASAKSIADYVQGLHYQQGRPWMGSGYNSDGTLDDTSKTLIARQLAPVPEAFACLERRVDAVCGIQAAISLRPSEPQGKPDDNGEPQPSESQMREMKAWASDISAWMDHTRAWGGKDLRKPTGVRGMVSQASASQSGSACLRLFFNPASRTQEFTTESGDVDRRIPKQKDRRTALRHIRVVAPPPERCAVYVDPDTHEKRAVFLFTDSAQNEGAEIWFARGDRTVLRMIAGGSDTEQEFPWGGWLPIQQADIGCLLTDAVRRLQGAVDFSATALVRLLQSMAWGQRTEIDAEDDGFWSTSPPAGVTNPRTRITDGTTEYFNPLPAGIGPEVIRRLVGYEYERGGDPATFGRTSPTVHYHEPSAPDGLIQGVDGFTMLIRYACHQGHVRSGLIGSIAEASGEAYEQARAAFVSDINGVGEEVDATFAPLLTTLTIMADWLTGNDSPADFAQEWIVGCQSHPNAGSPSAETQRVTKEMVDAELLSPEEGTARLGVQDVRAERMRIASAQTLSVKERVWTAVASAIGAGMDAGAVLEEFGFSDEQITKLLRTDRPPNVEQ